MRLVTCAAAALALLTAAPAFAQAPAGVPDPNTAAVPPPPPPVDPGAAAAVPPPPAPPVVEATPSIPIPPPATGAAPAAPAAPWYSIFKMEMLADSYYMYNFSGDTSDVAPAGRNFDTISNSFVLNYAKLGMQLDTDPVSVRVDLGYGQTGRILNSSLYGPSAPSTGTAQLAVTPGSVTLGEFTVQQAFASLKLGMVTFDFGRFVTTAGAEVIEANKNWLYSRSLLFYVIPLIHTGARANIKVNDMVSLQLSLVNGINVDPDNNRAKTVGGSITIAPLPTTSIIATTYIGKEGPQVATGDVRITGDLVVAHNINDAFGLNLNVDFIKQGEANLIGAALMGRYVAAEHLVLAARGEFVKDKNVLVQDTSLYEGTLMAGFPFAGGKYEARAELRGDFAADDIFPGVKSNQFTGTVAVLGSL